MSQPPDRQEDGSIEKDVIIEGHSYDGIQEYDNPMPGWWLWTFYATIAWSVFYIAAMGMGWIADYDRQLSDGQARITELKIAAEATAVTVDEATLLAAVDDAAMLARGEESFQIRCVACHGADGTGGIGPDLTDEEWVHGDSVTDIHRTISEGVLDKGMPAHSHLDAEDLIALTAFVKNL